MFVARDIRVERTSYTSTEIVTRFLADELGVGGRKIDCAVDRAVNEIHGPSIAATCVLKDGSDKQITNAIPIDVSCTGDCVARIVFARFTHEFGIRESQVDGPSGSTRLLFAVAVVVYPVSANLGLTRVGSGLTVVAVPIAGRPSISIPVEDVQVRIIVVTVPTALGRPVPVVVRFLVIGHAIAIVVQVGIADLGCTVMDLRSRVVAIPFALSHAIAVIIQLVLGNAAVAVVVDTVTDFGGVRVGVRIVVVTVPVAGIHAISVAVSQV